MWSDRCLTWNSSLFGDFDDAARQNVPQLAIVGQLVTLMALAFLLPLYEPIGDDAGIRRLRPHPHPDWRHLEHGVCRPLCRDFKACKVCGPPLFMSVPELAPCRQSLQAKYITAQVQHIRSKIHDFESAANPRKALSYPWLILASQRLLLAMSSRCPTQLVFLMSKAGESVICMINLEAS